MTYDYENRLYNSELEFRMRYAVHEKRAKLFQRTYPIQTNYPVFYLRYAVGLPKVLKSEFFYQRVEIGMGYNRFLRNFGRLNISLWGGVVSRNIPVMMLFNQSYLNRTLFLNEESKSKFNVLVNQTYAANQYINGFLYHDFGSLLYKMRSKVFFPRLSLSFSAGWSWLFAPEEHGGTPLYDMRRGYFETGVVVEDILRINVLNLYYIGLGGALYGAFGGSVETPFDKTLTPMIRLSFSL